MVAFHRPCFAFLITPLALGTHIGVSRDFTLSSHLLTSVANAGEVLGTNHTDHLIGVIKGYSEKIDKLASSAKSQDDYAKARSACQILEVLLGNRTISAESSAYQSERQDYWSTMCWLPAACFVQLQHTIDVVAALRVVTSVKSKFAVRSRGHNGNPGFSSIDQAGVLLDVKDLNTVGVNPDASIVSAGTGASWSSVYSTLDPYNVSAIGGRNGDVGVAGLILGGGMPYFPNLYGLASANVKNFQVVLADTSIVNANEDDNRDLYYALKGGGPNFGIVTRVDMYTVPTHKIWYNLAIYNHSDYAAILEATANIHKFAELDPKIGYFMNANPAGLFSGLLYAGWSTFPPAFEPFRNLTPAVTLAAPTNGTVYSLSQVLSEGEDASTRRYGVGITHSFNPSLYMPTHLKYRSLANFSGSDMGGLAYTIQPANGARMAKFQAQNGGSPFTIQPIDQDWIVTFASWASETNDASAMAAVENLRTDIQDRAQKSDNLLDLIFMNDAGANQSPLRSYGNEVLETLKEIAKKYDPEGVFQRLQGGGFLLSLA
ncbi:FAD-binding domain-containing protein [Zopfia rhizophila CBS 207.26]|uniref:FAD-binding domain-containing protein n=1 Tax=Zopfia rhizophila CBS 207.26 TaxID=1314779 RepID=A0A6A6E4W3_9PEZI|nr:FAD-binding domain-containing protein [Zopfia rhizophila CBS 207.26]